LRIEIGYTDTENDIDKITDNGTNVDLSTAGTNVNLEQETISAMLLYDFYTEGSWNPYVGIGVGNVDADLTVIIPASGLDYTRSASETAFIFAAGINWGISGNMDLFVEYRMTSWDSSGIDIENDTLLVGVNWAF
jgi:opacity protein-like surface antigen